MDGKKKIAIVTATRAEYGILKPLIVALKEEKLFDVQVIVYESDHKLFDESSLIQIAGRVGRKMNAPSGKVFFLSTITSKEMNICIKEIIEKNKSVV